MAESKLTDQILLTAGNAAANDLVYIVDVSDNTGGAAGTSKKATISTLMGQAPVVSVNGRTGVVVLSLDDLNDVTATGPTTDDTLVWSGSAWVLSSGLRDLKNVVKYPSGTLTGLQVNATNKIEIDSTNQNVTFTVNGNVVAVIGTTQTSVPGLSVGPTGTTYALPTARGTTTGHVIVYDSATHTSTWSALATSQLSGTSDGLTEGTTKLLMTSPERTKLGTVTSGAAVASVSGTAPIVSSGGTTPAISIPASSSTADGYMSSSQWTKLDGIQAGAQVNAVTSVNTQTGAVVLTTSNITEGTNLYYTDTRADARTLGARDQTLTGTRTVNLNANILNYVNGATTVFQVNTTLSASWVPLSVQSTSATAQSLQLYEGTSGNNYIALKAPDTLTANTTYTLPNDGSSGQVASTNGTGTISWVTKKVTSVSGKTVATGAWSFVSGVYEASISDAAILSTSIVDVIPNNADASTIRTAGLLPRTDSSAGAVKIYATSAPAATITVTLNIFDL